MDITDKSIRGRFDMFGVHHMTVNTGDCRWISGKHFSDRADEVTDGYARLRSRPNTGQHVPLFFDGISADYSDELNIPGACVFRMYFKEHLLTTNTVCISCELSDSLWIRVNGDIPMDRRPCPSIPWMATDIDEVGWTLAYLAGNNLLWAAWCEEAIALAYVADPFGLNTRAHAGTMSQKSGVPYRWAWQPFISAHKSTRRTR